MPRTYTQLFYHIVFSTRDRKPQLTDDLKARLVPYIGGIVREMGGRLVACNGPSDHLHSVVLLPPRISVSEAAQAIKGGSSRWLHEDVGAKEASRQQGYSGFTIGHREVPVVCKYVESQASHHREVPFKEELIRLLDEAGVEYDERYLWD